MLWYGRIRGASGGLGPCETAQLTQQAALAQQLEEQARWAEDGEAEGSPYLALAAHLRTLMARLEGGD